MTALFDTDVYAHRLERAAEISRRDGLAGLVLGTGPDFEYLLGSKASSHERLTALVIPAEGRPAVVSPETDLADLDESAVPGLDVDVLAWRDGDDAHQLAADRLGEAPGPVGYGASLTADHLLPLMEKLPGREARLATSALAELFVVKEPDEIEQLRGAARAIDAVHARVPDLLIPGRTENEVAAELDRLIRAEHDEVDFVIVGSGPNGANPHHSHSDRILSEGDLVVVDLGGSFGLGYHSDCTRTYVVGGDPESLSKEERHLYEVLEEAFAAAAKAARPGVAAGSVDAAARDVIEAAGFGDAFFHRLGHGIGLAGHEEPFLLPGSEVPLREGMCFSIEPGIYLRGRYGARIEDIVTVTANGVEHLNANPRVLR
ncbi:M24 family metallopeptidase [Corynebacterium otitidis]|uniref:M24 family metallopeptidase n=1 Tax=Corynebacterium otitidis TaxID=29321 RepID=UPI00062785AA|nr:Xaa-Pro peptidase family protein [Corynebacterium otitidis]KKO84601.1 peptidase M24 [Corynebacterium otitidis]